MNKSNSHLRVTLICGFILLIFSGGFLVFFFLANRNSFAASNPGETFSYSLREWDTAYSELFFTEKEFDYLSGELDQLEKSAISVESWLSVLKRRRMLADIYPPSSGNYFNSINKALAAFPSSQPITALACAAVIKNAAINARAREQLRAWLPVLTDSDYYSLRVAIHALLGDFKSPQASSAIPTNLYMNNNYTSAALPYTAETRAVNINLAVLKTLNRDYSGAASDIQGFLYSGALRNSALVLYFAAEFHYDFGELLRSAEIFSYLSMLETDDIIAEDFLTKFPADYAMIRQADALYLAGFTEMAAAIWRILADDTLHPNETSLYNLSLTSADPDMYYNYLEKLVNMGQSKNENRASSFGLIRYSRLLDYDQALVLLEDKNWFSSGSNPYIDLEISKRYARGQILGRQLARTWLLLDYHENNEDLYKWAAWHFNFQKQYDEMKILQNRIHQMGFSGAWVNIYDAASKMREGDLEKAGEILRLILSKNADDEWLIYANLGRILEAERFTSRALEHYEIAAANAANPKNAARVQKAISRCYITINRPNEARRALVIASDLDPDDIAIRLELDRFF
ncbi:MAG: hypothetical protein FWC21_00085 [Treponema sp.]|nr:hypothetical protein [Treponema sp.]